MSDWYLGQLARQDPDWREPQVPPPVAPGALAEQTTYDPWQRAAAAVRFGAKPLGGRQEGVATTLPQEILAAPVRAAAGFTKAAFDRAAEEHGGVPQISTDYDPRRMGALLGAETAMNVVGLPALTGGVPASALGSGARAGRYGMIENQEALKQRALDMRNEGRGSTGKVFETTAQMEKARGGGPEKGSLEHGFAEIAAKIAHARKQGQAAVEQALFPQQYGNVYAEPAKNTAELFARQRDPDAFFSNFTDRKTGAVLGGLAAMDEYRPPFYSAVERAVQGAKQNVAPGQQWAGYLRNQPGVKPDELEALKLGELFSQQGALSKQAVLDQIAANRVNVGEVVKGVGPPHQFGTPEQQAAARERLETARREMMDTRRQVGTPEWVAAGEEHRAAEAAMRDIVPGWGRAPDTTANPTKHSTWVMPGGENYREMLLTLPTKKVTPSPAEVENIAKTRYEGYHRKENDPPWERIAPDVQRLYREQASEKIIAAESGPTYRSSHYDEPNILAHVRYNDRIIDGKKTLFVEEVQSDWHQAGRTKGYAKDTAGWTAKSLSKPDAGFTHWEITDASGNYVTKIVGGSRENAIRKAAEGIPDAPFKTTWPELAMKRIIREAAEKGYDKVAWTPGSVQAARYDLSKHVKKIDYNPESGKLWGYDHSNAAVIDTRVSNDKLADYIGKEAAEKLLSSQADKGWHRLEGTDLQVGGEGMKGFYDEILPATVNKLVKKHGGRVQQGQMASGDVSKFDIEQTGGGWRIVDKEANEGQGQFVGGVFRSGADAEKWLTEKGYTNQNVHTFDITPSLREQALKKGFPLFTVGGIAATGAMGELARRDKYQ